MDERTPDSIEMARPATPASASITYAPAEPPISRRAFRMLFFLTLLNTILLGGYVLGPAFHAFGKQQWAGYQQRKAERKAAEALAAKRAAAMATERAALAYAPPPPTTLVYDDDPARRELHTAGAATRPTSLAPWPAVVPQPPEYRSLPAIVPRWGQLLNPSVIVLFMGERRASASSEPRLVIVYCQPQQLLRLRNQAPSDQVGSGDREFMAATIRPTTSQVDLHGTAFTAHRWRPPSRPPGDPRPAPFLRLFAGQPDPKDASMLMLPYELAGTRGIIVGRLQSDDTVQLTPDGPLTNGWTVEAARPL